MYHVTVLYTMTLDYLLCSLYSVLCIDSLDEFLESETAEMTRSLHLPWLEAFRASCAGLFEPKTQGQEIGNGDRGFRSRPF